jgi:hypothetical protein
MGVEVTDIPIFDSYASFSLDYPCGIVRSHRGACRQMVETNRRVRQRFRKALECRNPASELEAFKDALCLRYNAAQRLFNE